MVKRVVAIVAVALLLLMYVAVFITAVFASPENGGALFMAALGTTFLVSVILWFFMRLYDRAHAHDDEQISASEMRKYSKRIRKGENPDKIADEILEKYNKNTKEDK